MDRIIHQVNKYVGQMPATKGGSFESANWLANSTDNYLFVGVIHPRSML